MLTALEIQDNFGYTISHDTRRVRGYYSNSWNDLLLFLFVHISQLVFIAHSSISWPLYNFVFCLLVCLPFLTFSCPSPPYSPNSNTHVCKPDYSYVWVSMLHVCVTSRNACIPSNYRSNSTVKLIMSSTNCIFSAPWDTYHFP